MLKTLGKTTWKEIEVGEVFVNFGCVQIAFKSSQFSHILLAEDFLEDFSEGKLYGIEYEKLTIKGEEFNKRYIFRMYSLMDNLYKLPLSVQRLWRCDYD